MKNPFEKMFGNPQSAEEREAQQKTRNNAMAAIGVAAAVAGTAAVTHEVDQMTAPMNAPVPATAPAEVNNPTLGMKSTDAPRPITIPSPEAKKYNIELGGKQYDINLSEPVAAAPGSPVHGEDNKALAAARDAYGENQNEDSVTPSEHLNHSEAKGQLAGTEPPISE